MSSASIKNKNLSSSNRKSDTKSIISRKTDLGDTKSNLSKKSVSLSVKNPSASKKIDTSRVLGEDESIKQSCPFYGWLTEKCDISCRKEPSLESVKSKDSSEAAEKFVKQILKDVIRDVFKATTPKTKKRMEMKSGWMNLGHVIPKFDINDELFDNITFRENLLVSTFNGNPNPTPVGGLTLDIQSAKGGPFQLRDKQKPREFKIPKFLVHLSSQFDFYGHHGGSTITAWVDRSLQTLEEHRKEYVHLSTPKVEVIYINKQEKFYYLRHNRKDDIIYTPERAKYLICEGASFILMRYLALTKFVGAFELSTVYINGDLCRNIYECRGPSSGIINDKKLDVCKIHRIIIEESGIVHRCATLMTLQGQILKQEWEGTNFILQINPLIDVKNEKPSGFEKIPLEKRFHEDVQMMSLYLDAKERAKKTIQTYMEDNDEIKKLIADYVQTILQLKPEDVFEFTAKYFLSFTPHLLPQTEYFVRRSFDEDEIDDYEFWRYF